MKRSDVPEELPTLNPPEESFTAPDRYVSYETMDIFISSSLTATQNSLPPSPIQQVPLRNILFLPSFFLLLQN